MAKSPPSPFSGIKLTEQTPLAESSLDQRLFSNSPTQSANAKSKRVDETKKPETQEVGKEGSREVGKEVYFLGSREVGKLFDINENPHRKDSFLFTDKEFEALEDLKLELKRKFDLKATKNVIARCALQHIFEDYEQNKENSIVVRILKNRTPR
jgi:hypothetical protein